MSSFDRALLLALVFGAQTASAQDVSDIAAAGHRIEADAVRTSNDLDAILNAGEAARQAAGRDVAPIVESMRHAAPAPKPAERVYFFVSASLGEAALADIIDEATRVGPCAVVVFRGIADGESIQSAAARIGSFVRDRKSGPSIAIDPVAFRRFGITAVPAIGTGDGKQRTIAYGLVSWRRFTELQSRHSGDWGKQGDLQPIAEPDLEDVIKARAASLDYAGLRRDAEKRAWSQVQFETLPVATEARMRRVDPTLVATRDVALPSGVTLVHAGDRINPFDRLPFTRPIAVFDASDPRQVAWAQRFMTRARERNPILLVSGFERESGWDGWRGLEADLGAPVFLLTSEIKSRFALEHVPVLITPDKGEFIVSEEVLPAISHEVQP